MRPKKIVVLGFIGNMPIAGVIWQHIHYLLGLQRLGHEVWYLEDSNRCPYNPVSAEIEDAPDYAVATIARLAQQFGFHWAFVARWLPGQPCFGLDQAAIHRLYREADAVLNICGATELHEDLAACERLLYVESDPGLEQVTVDNAGGQVPPHLARPVRRFSFGELIGTPAFPVPLHGVEWLPTRQPVVTDLWRPDTATPAPTAQFTSIANWSTAGLKDITWRGDTYLWSKSLEFLRFAEAPAAAGETFELATNLKDPAIRAQLTGQGWHLTSPERISIHWDDYRAYIQASKGEFTVAKDQYVRLNTGWFSDRSACYLAAGRPVITQETGFSDLYGGDHGLLPFRTLADIVEAVARINADYAAHARAAREIACEFFEAEKVLADLLKRAGV